MLDAAPRCEAVFARLLGCRTGEGGQAVMDHQVLEQDPLAVGAAVAQSRGGVLASTGRGEGRPLVGEGPATGRPDRDAPAARVGGAIVEPGAADGGPALHQPSGLQSGPPIFVGVR